LADAVEQGTARAIYRGWFFACLALIAYRDGRFEQATEHCKKSRALNQGIGQDGALALLVQALAQHQLKQADQARKSLSQGTALIPPELATLGSPEFQGPVPVAGDVGADWLIAEILRREAALLILKDARRQLDAAALRSLGLQFFNQGKLPEA